MPQGSVRVGFAGLPRRYGRADGQGQRNVGEPEVVGLICIKEEAPRSLGIESPVEGILEPFLRLLGSVPREPNTS